MAITRYASNGTANIAYQITGDGPRDLVYVPGWISNVEVMWEEPSMARFLRRLGSFSRLIVFDKRGTGMSDPVPLESLPTLEERMDDVRAVMDASGSEKATLLGHSEGGNMSILFAATYPERTEGLILVGSYAKRIQSEDYPWAPPPGDRKAEIEEVERTFGDPDALPSWLAPSRMDDEAFRNWMARYFRLSSSPKAAAHLLEMNTYMNTTAVLPSVHVPTLCLYREKDTDVSVEEGRWIASQIPNSRFVAIPGADHLLNASGANEILDEIEVFVTGHRTGPTPERTLATVLFTDIVGSTETAAEMGDDAWRDLLERHNAVVRSEVEAYRGRVIGTQGDGFLATFDGPGRAISAAHAIVRALDPLRLEVRSGLHTGEIEIVGDDVAGLAVHIGARVAALAAPGDVLVSRTVKDLVVGSGIEFEDRGTHSLKGIPDKWQIFAAK
ncbi:MAG: adenylate/guanylate cyclase domain-containing protein [Actinomycetota bacterium]|nr:adenylate/guanylate cyclase domain-containing protein [Actinomycetota bacterium]